MEINESERLILLNQYKILSVLNPEEADTYEINMEILERGYKLHYNELNQMLSSEIPEEETSEVLDILNMYRLLFYSVKGYADKGDPDFKNKHIVFPGFDGNNEATQLGYAKFFLHKMQRFEELRHQGEFPSYNTHCMTLHIYRKMLIKINTFGQHLRELSKDQIKEVLKVGMSGSLVEDIK